MQQPDPIHSIVCIESSALTNRTPHQRIRRLKLHIRQDEVEVIPRFIIMDADGTARRTSEGAMQPDELLAWLKKE